MCPAGSIRARSTTSASSTDLRSTGPTGWARWVVAHPWVLALLVALLLGLSAPGVRVIGLQVDIVGLYVDRAGASERPAAPLVVAFDRVLDGPALEDLAARIEADPAVDAAAELDRARLLERVLPAVIIDRALAEGWALSGLEDASGLMVRAVPGREAEAVTHAREILAEVDGASILGLPILEEALTAQSRRDLPWLLGLAAVVMAIVLALGGRTWRAVVLPLAAVVVATGATVGVAGLLGLSLGGPNVLVPVVVLVFGLADAVYVVHAWARREEPDLRERLASTLAEVALPCALTTGTTAISLLLLVPVTSLPLARFAGLSAVGIVLALVSGLALPVLALRLFPGPTVRRGRLAPMGWVDRLMRGLGRSRWVLAVVGVLLLLGGALAAPNLRPSLRLLDELPASDPIRLRHERSTVALQGLPVLEVQLRSAEGVGDPMLYRALLQTHGRVEQQAQVGSVLSFADVALWIGRAEGRPPDTLLRPRATHGQSRILRAAHRALLEDNGEAWALPSGEGYRLHARLTSWAPQAWIDVVDAVHAMPAPEGGQLSTGGFIDVAVRGARRIPRDLWVSCLATCVGLVGVLALGLRSWRRALWGLLPGLLATATTALGLWALQIGLTEAVVLAFALALGVGVDVWIHLSLHADRGVRAGLSDVEAKRESLRALLGPILWTTSLLVLGLAGLLTAGLATPGDVARVVGPAFVLDVSITIVVFILAPCASSRVGDS